MLNTNKAKNVHTAVAMKVCNVLRKPELAAQGVLKPVDITAFEAALVDDFQKLPWLQKLIACVVDDGASLSMRQVNA